GEPLTHPDFLPILLYSVNHFDQVGILTNGTLIYRYIDELTELSREKGTAKKMFFSVSLYGPSGNIHDGITGVKGSFDLTIKGIKSLVKLGYFVRISMALMKQNVDYLEKTLDFARQLGVNSFNWDNTQPTGRGENTESKVYDYNNNQINLMHSQELVNKYKGFVPIIPYEQIKDKIAFGNCGAGHKNMVISPFGDLRPCSFLQKEFIPFGNIKDAPEIALNSEQGYYWSNLIQPGGKICEGCPYYSYCNGCFVRAVLAMRDQGKICEWGKSVNINKYLNFVIK
ncbi:SPASM domain-containing protein, partial [bacterium]|nr:SPASM domain-containing protein [bacterium]